MDWQVKSEKEDSMAENSAIQFISGSEGKVQLRNWNL